MSCVDPMLIHAVAITLKYDHPEITKNEVCHCSIFGISSVAKAHQKFLLYNIFCSLHVLNLETIVTF